MIKKPTKRIMSIGLCALLLTSNVNASLWDNDSIFINKTSSGLATDPSTGVQYLSGGGVEIRFKNTGSFPPAFSFGAPKVNASCRGITFDAGYAMFMNLERLGQQLSQAGSSLAYGVLIGLVYSMPGIQQAFTKLNEWSQWLQKFLSDACNIGQNWGKEIGGDLVTSTKLDTLSNAVNNFIPSPEDVINQNPSIEKFMKKIYNDGTDETIKKANNEVINALIKHARGGLISSYLNTLINNGEENINFNDDEIIEEVSIDELGLKQSTLIMAYFLSALTNDIAIKSDAITPIKNAIKSKDEKEVNNMLKSISNEYNARAIQARNESSISEIISFILNGTKTNKLGELNKLYIAKVNFKDEDSNKKQFVLLTTKTNGKTTAFKDFDGYINESKKLISHVYNQTLINLHGNGATNPISKSDIKVTVVYPDTFKLIRNLILYHDYKDFVDLNKEEANTPIKNTLQFLSYKNAIGLTNIAINNISTVISQISDRDKDNENKSDKNKEIKNSLNNQTSIDDLIKQKEVLNKKIEEMKKNLEKYSKTILDNDNIQNIADDLDKKIKEKNISGAK